MPVTPARLLMNRVPPQRIRTFLSLFALALTLPLLALAVFAMNCMASLEEREIERRALQVAQDLGVVLMDIRLIGSRDGIDAADEIAGRLGIGSIFVTANADAQTRRRAEAIQPLGFLEKPLTEQRLRLGLSKLVE